MAVPALSPFETCIAGMRGESDMNIELIINQEDAIAFGREFGGLQLDDLRADKVAFAIDSAQGSLSFCLVRPVAAGASQRHVKWLTWERM
ncbi:hypothetical protein HSBAA_PA_2810 (plasmid) [Vreelandella sulfidaeris]|uniref:Uncharacterized protein n=1 Tax=Vreelandella sulfidaeris TaxID=115553 RepID=A0A455UMZ0_9GAMM|nr:hypothetical protein HSBAA_PA_2810 [Halomonas sulfidaeris]